MPWFYTHLTDENGKLEDDEGSDFVNLAAARRNAITAGAAIIANELSDDHSHVAFTLHIEDANHHPLIDVPMFALIETVQRVVRPDRNRPPG